MHTLSTEWVYSALNLSNVMSNMANVQEHLVDSTSPLQRSVYLITDSQCDASGLTKADFAKVILDSWKVTSFPHGDKIEYKVALAACKKLY